ncbi:peptidylprolyl isomerase [Rhizobium sp. BK251]|uniref:SurA N-terminal domain-containing protein n=1 Tax=Rhizobium sp. BK251 TaxID=2512125 RepID=UPI0010467B7D|nr:peptidylprolyl isomerase [Rhizobium sp. BK251]
MLSGRSAMRALVAGAAALAFTAVVEPLGSTAYAASEVKAVVNNVAITSGDVAKRAAFLRLQHQKADAKTAEEQLIDETLKRQEISRLHMSVSTQDVDAAYARFAQNNKMTTEQLNKILDQSGVTPDHFKNYIAVSMSWPRAVNARYGSANRLTSAQLVERMNQNKEKPVTTEYILQQVIFVIPAAKKNAITAKRKAEAEASRAKYPGCDQAKVFAATMRDVSIRELGRVLAPELPSDWKDLVLSAKGTTTGTRVTDRGVEYLAICKQRQVNDDVAAEMVFREEDLGKEKGKAEQGNPNSAKYIEDLRKKAQILYR